MARSQQTWNKIENEKKKQKKKKDKAAKKLERSTNTSDGNSLDDMMAYVDEYGRISDTPPDPTAKKIVIKVEDIEVGVRKKEDMDPVDEFRTGIVTFFNDSKGFGFIKDLLTGDSIFVHIKELAEPIKENNKVTFKIERGPKGLSAFEVKVVR
ncbi:MAG: DNA-binding protein [Bacteroidetes bacterium HGW-Bacteroidetes-11]|jgi:cold shock CspA family protein|nr:MAG: DNA-binding protein [Bacteroidetes bacterium HGW-Bacteroidetes-11]